MAVIVGLQVDKLILKPPLPDKISEPLTGTRKLN